MSQESVCIYDEIAGEQVGHIYTGPSFLNFDYYLPFLLHMFQKSVYKQNLGWPSKVYC